MELGTMSNNVSRLTDHIMSWAVVALPNLIAAILIFLIGWWLAGRVEKGVGALLTGQTRMDKTLVSLLSRLARYAIILIILVAGLSQLGIETTSVIAALGAIGLAIGLALQGTLANIAAGVMLLWLRPFNVGDFIEVDGEKGTVQELGLFGTFFTTIEGVFEFVPNGELWNKRITNFSRMPWRMIRETFTISYDDDIQTAREVLLHLVGSDQRIVDEPAPIIKVDELGDNAVELELRAWAKTSDYAATRWDVLESGKIALEAAGLTIPYPQRDVHLHNAGSQVLS